jgi:hypothetical protein
LSALDPQRFPWMSGTMPRAATSQERDTAIRWTAGLLSIQEVQTSLRGTEAKRQEQEVENALIGCGFVKVTPRPIRAVDALARGEFCRESQVAGSKCDLPARLHDGRLLLVECKVSNSALNSVKRLNHEVADKARRWRNEFGAQAITLAALSGVYSLKSLLDAQAQGIFIVWEHGLSSLAAFLHAAA